MLLTAQNHMIPSREKIPQQIKIIQNQLPKNWKVM